MSSIFRATFINKKMQLYSNFLNFTFNLSIHNSNNCRFKFSMTSLSLSHRKYSTMNNIKDHGVTDSKNEKELIYTGILSKQIRNIKILTLATSTFGLLVQPLIYFQTVSSGTVNTISIPLFAIIAFLSLLTPPTINLITKKYVIDVEYIPKEDKYVASVYNLFAGRRKIEFTPEDVTIPTVLGMFTSCAIKGKPLFLDAEYFKDQKHYARIMGYDKPLNLKLGMITNESNNKKNVE